MRCGGPGTPDPGRCTATAHVYLHILSQLWQHLSGPPEKFDGVALRCACETPGVSASILEKYLPNFSYSARAHTCHNLLLLTGSSHLEGCANSTRIEVRCEPGRGVLSRAEPMQYPNKHFIVGRCCPAHLLLQ